jgi:hypothetical protein
MIDAHFFSSRLDLRMFHDVEGGLTVREPWVAELTERMQQWGWRISHERVAVRGTARLHAQVELIFGKGVDLGLLTKIEEWLTQKAVKFQRHQRFMDEEMIDAYWDMENVSDLKSG